MYFIHVECVSKVLDFGGLAKSERWFRSIFNTSSLGIVSPVSLESKTERRTSTLSMAFQFLLQLLPPPRYIGKFFIDRRYHFHPF